MPDAMSNAITKVYKYDYKHSEQSYHLSRDMSRACADVPHGANPLVHPWLTLSGCIINKASNIMYIYIYIYTHMHTCKTYVYNQLTYNSNNVHLL